jgi:ribonuclease P protein component
MLHPRRVLKNEADIQAAESQADQQARISVPDGDEGWAQNAQPSPQQGPARVGRGHRFQVKTVKAARPDEGAPVGFRLPRTSRIHRPGEIRVLMRRGKRKRTSHLDVFFHASPVSHSRLGLVVPKHRQRIVDRNLLKRRLRELGRTEVLPQLEGAPMPWDILIRARREAYGAGFEELREELAEVTRGLCSETPFSR